jgi:hypothetical protein
MVLSFILIQNRQYVAFVKTCIDCVSDVQQADILRLAEGRRGWRSGMRHIA